MNEAAVGVGPAAVVLVDATGAAVWANDVAHQLAEQSSQGMERLLSAVADAIRDNSDSRMVTARVPTDAGLLERHLSIEQAGGGLRVVTFEPDPAVRTGPARVDRTKRLEAMLERTVDLVTVLDGEGNVLMSNAAAGRLTGYTGAVANGANALDFVHPDDADRVAECFLTVLSGAGPHPQIDVRLRFADGSWHDIEATPENLLHDPYVGGVIVTMHDITDRKVAEAEAARSTAYLQSLIENLSDVIVVLDRSFEVVWTSPSLSTVIDAPVETNIGMSAFNDIHPDDLEGVVNLLATVSDAPLGETARVELRLEARPGSGEWRWIEATTVNRLGDPHVNGIVCTLRDVTEAKAAADELQAAFERERTTAERLRELDVLKDQFLASVSHEMRTPLAIIIGFADLLQRGPEVSPDIRGESVDRIHASASEMRAMVENLLDFSALEAGKLVLRRRPVPLRASVEATVGTIRTLLDDHPLGIDIADDVLVDADPDAVDRIVRNLVLNAAKYSDRGRPVFVRARRTGDDVDIEVVDEGIGIAEDQWTLIFERLYRAPGAAFVARGTGVGLNMVRRYAELMSGTVEVSSELGRGSTFTVRLPSA